MANTLLPIMFKCTPITGKCTSTYLRIPMIVQPDPVAVPARSFLQRVYDIGRGSEVHIYIVPVRSYKMPLTRCWLFFYSHVSRLEPTLPKFPPIQFFFLSFIPTTKQECNEIKKSPQADRLHYSDRPYLHIFSAFCLAPT